jgi:hypothetical protein
MAANAREGYSAAIALWQYEGNTIWTKFAAMVAANAILLATLGLLVTSGHNSDLALLRFAVAGLGIVLCSAWLLMTSRSFGYYKYWILSAREIEKKYLAPVTIVYSGSKFADGKQVTVDEQDHQLNCLGRFRINWLTYGVIVGFIVVYVLFMVHHVLTVVD